MISDRARVIIVFFLAMFGFDISTPHVAGAVKADLQLREIWIRVPDKQGDRHNKALRVEKAQDVYRISGWLNTDDVSAITAYGIQHYRSGPRKVFETIRSLLRAYENRSLREVMDLYTDDSKEAIERNLKDDDAKKAWLESVARVTSMRPLLIWKNGDDEIVCMAQTRFRARLKAGKMESELSTQLDCFFVRQKGKVTDILINYGYINDALVASD